MDKMKVIKAYHRGMITMQECAQILGVDSLHILDNINVNGEDSTNKLMMRNKESANG